MPSRVVVYATSGLALAHAGFAESPRSEATVQVTVPADRTVWNTSVSLARPDLADPVLVAWDVLRTGGPDAPEAARHLKHATFDRGRGDNIGG
ncbi:hypothetical protein [Demequina sediminicola]|uniref:hypothetical protein n=1 Tax=Demequina sediminicola TaxID=1095026 RepID=UPI00128B5D8E|nr:hypothetical protein [Demequina sediminicola]